MYSIVCRMYLHCRFDPTQAAAAVARYRIDGGWTAPALPGRDYVSMQDNPFDSGSGRLSWTVLVAIFHIGHPRRFGCVWPDPGASGVPPGSCMKLQVNCVRTGVHHRRGFNCARNYDFTSPKLLPFIAEMRVERLAMNLEELSKFRSIILAHPLFHSVTLRISTYLASSASQRNLYQMARTPHVYDVPFVIEIDGDYWGNWLVSARGAARFLGADRRFRGV
ncbi:hypothetical protein B0H14DRAFT_2621950 [Mycena olivaceomarginata]|nr:hypothetical protein B0H14DRAFT_2621950 [Mycena olivaceomarginata]